MPADVVGLFMRVNGGVAVASNGWVTAYTPGTAADLTLAALSAVRRGRSPAVQR